MFAAVQQHYGLAGDPDRLVEQLVSIDSTSVRAHQHAAGARRQGPARVDGVKRGTIELQESGGLAGRAG
jgi:hypothetical protein